MKPRVIASIEDALTAIEAIEQMANEIGSFERYQKEDFYRWAVERQFAILGEALYRVDDLDPNLRVAIPELGEVIGMRNMIEYDYDVVDNFMVWTTILEDVVPLKARLRAVLVGQ